MSSHDCEPDGALAIRSAILRKSARATALVEATAFSLDPKNKSAVLQTIMREFKLADPADAEKGYADLANLYRKPYVSVESLKKLQRIITLHDPKVLDLKVEELIEDRFVRKLDESGAIDRLYADTRR